MLSSTWVLYPGQLIKLATPALSAPVTTETQLPILSSSASRLLKV